MKILLLILIVYSSNSYSKEIAIKVNGMVCSLCAQGISKNIKNMKQIEHFEVDLEKKYVFISTKDNQDISDIEINSAINNAGYSVVKIERK